MPALFRSPASRRSPLAPLTVLAAVGLASVAAPAHATTGHDDEPRTREAGSLARPGAVSSPTMAVLGAPARRGHTVRSGDTLSEIARDRGVSVSELRRANGISGSTIRPGQKLAVPSSAGSAAGASSSRPATKAAASTRTSSRGTSSGGHTVRRGETLSQIAKRNGVSVAAVQAANPGVDPRALKIGQNVSVPSAATAAAGSSRVKSGAPTAARPASGGHTVRRGETLSQIAKRNGVSVAAVQSANPGVDPRALQIGQNVRVPSAAAAASGSTARTASTPAAAKSSSRAVGSTFAGRTYPESVVAAANDNHSRLAARPKASRDALQRTVVSAAQRHGVDPTLAQAIARQESGFQQHVVSPANAVGVMQVTPSAGRWASQMAGRDLDLLDPNDNATAGVLVLRANLQAADNEDQAIAAYYQGLSSVRKNGMYADTRGYVSSVQRNRGQFR